MLSIVKSQFSHCTFWRGDKLQGILVLLHKALDEIYLLQGDLYRVLVLGTAGRVRNPQLQHKGLILQWRNKIKDDFASLKLNPNFTRAEKQRQHSIIAGR